MEKKKKIILSFDLDNTLIDNREGIVNSFNYALNKHNLPEMENPDIEKMIGIPLAEMFQKISNLEPASLIFAFRDYYGKEGIYQAKLLPGVKRKLEQLSALGFTLGIITSKKHEMAIRIVKYMGIYRYFEYILGESEEVKSKLDPNLKRFLLDTYPEAQFLIIGDHPKDKALAENLRVPFIGVLTGNHSAAKLQQNSTVKTQILSSVKEIKPKMIYSLL
jgi:phosphoglycolate phosphatase